MGARGAAGSRGRPADTVIGTWLILALVGAWLMLSTLTLNYGPGDSEATAVISGAVLLVLALAALPNPAVRPLSYAVLVIGAWLLASAFILADSRGVQLNLGLMAGVVAVMALVSLGARLGDGTRRRGLD